MIKQIYSESPFISCIKYLMYLCICADSSKIPRILSVQETSVCIIFWLQLWNKNLAIANRSRISYAHNTLRVSIGINITPWPWNLGQGSLKVTGNRTIG